MTPTTFFLVSCGIVALVGIPLILRVIPPNRWHGIRTRRTLSNREVWFRVNHFAGWAIVLAAGVSAVLLCFAPEGRRAASLYGVVVFALPLFAAVGASFWYLGTVGESLEER
jgi:uncharacterized membrane protein